MTHGPAQDCSRHWPLPGACLTRRLRWLMNSWIETSMSRWLRSGPSASSRNVHVYEIRGRVLCRGRSQLAVLSWDWIADDRQLVDGSGEWLACLSSCDAVDTPSPIRRATMLWLLHWQPVTSVAMHCYGPVQYTWSRMVPPVCVVFITCWITLGRTVDCRASTLKLPTTRVVAVLRAMVGSMYSWTISWSRLGDNGGDRYTATAFTTCWLAERRTTISGNSSSETLMTCSATSFDTISTKQLTKMCSLGTLAQNTWLWLNCVGTLSSYRRVSA